MRYNGRWRNKHCINCSIAIVAAARPLYPGALPVCDLCRAAVAAWTPGELAYRHGYAEVYAQRVTQSVFHYLRLHQPVVTGEGIAARLLYGFSRG
ncbi:hypothetical protein BG74_02920 [Sodalis-like endosymbiont of Proechinophthirus fluctus]|nr:hypothetical protein BG74_02920 [Sodalis-like endosymbiont of Proechinophthirus fluctus]